MSTFNRVRELANEKMLPIAEVERRAGLTSQTIGNWRRSKPSGESLEKVAKVFEVSVDYLLERTDNRVPINDISTVDIANPLIKLSFNNHELNDKQRNDINVYIKTMIATGYW